MSSLATHRLGKSCLVAVVLLSLAFSHASVGLLGQTCNVATETVEASCGDCCSSQPSAPTDECPTGCDACPCCPGVAPAVLSGPNLVVALAPSTSSDVVTPGAIAPVDADRLFRPPRLQRGC